MLSMTSYSSREGTQLGQPTQTSQRAIPYHMMSRLVYELRVFAAGQWSLLGDRLGVVHWVVSNCICASLVLYILLLSLSLFLPLLSY